MLSQRLNNAIIASLTCVVLSGCVSLRAPTLDKQQTSYQKSTPLTRQQRLKALSAWKIQGAVSVKQPKQSFIANYQWTQQQDRIDLSLHSSLDLASMQLSGQPGQITMKTSNGKTIKARSLAQLMQRELGWAWPVQNLRYWVRSLPAPGAANMSYNDLGQTTRIRQGGWTVSLSRYQRIDGLELPTFLNIAGHSLQMRIVIKSWQLL